MLDTTTDTRRPPLQTWYPKPINVAQRWEFIPPVVAVPPGWIQIQNASTGRVLSHKYITYQPILITPPTPQPLHYREGWETQWIFDMLEGQEEIGLCNPKSTVWIIRNRLTGAILTQYHDLMNKEYSIGALDRRYVSNPGEVDWWCPEIDSGGAWIIRNKKTYFLLEESTNRRHIGYELKCDDRVVHGVKAKIWNFVYIPSLPGLLICPAKLNC